MIIVMPTCDAYVAVAEISLALLGRYWEDHPPVHVLHRGVAPRVVSGARVTLHHVGPGDVGWLGPVVRFLEGRADECVLLMLDDYAVYRAPEARIILGLERLFEAELRVGLAALSWYPARRRTPRDGWPGWVTLGGAPILLQAAVWRRSAFLELARGLDPLTSASGFERQATQRAKACGIEMVAAEMAAPQSVGGHFLDGLDKADWPLPYHNLMHAGRLDPRHLGFLHGEGFAVPSRGLGDTVERIARATGMARLAKWAERATGRDCGCGRRREALNAWMPYPR